MGAFPLKLVGSERKQWMLYHHWPAFWWRDGFMHDATDDGRRHVTPALPHPGAQYLAVERVAPTGAVFVVGMPDRNAIAGSAQQGLAAALTNLLFRSTGLPICSRAIAARRIGWDRVIWDLLESLNRTVRSKHSKYYTGLLAYRVGHVPPSLLRVANEAEVLAGWKSLPEGGTGFRPPGEDRPYDDRRPPLITLIEVDIFADG
jgi:hypothetical protein